MRQLVALLFTCALLSGCLATKPKPEALPDWVLSPSQDNPATLYASGSGFDRAQAEKQAIAQLISRIRVSVQSKLQIAKVDDRGVASTVAEERINSEVRKTEISQYDVARTFNDGEQVHVMIAVDRGQLIKLWRDKHHQFVRQLTQAYNHRSGSPWGQLMAVREWLSRVDEGRYWAELLSSLGDDSARDQQSQAEAQADQYLAQIKNDLRVTVTADAGLAELSGYLSTALAKEGIRTQGSGGNVVIALTQKEKKQELFGSKQLLLTVALKVLENGQLLQQSRYKAKGASAKSYADAATVAQQQLKAQWSALPVWQLLQEEEQQE